MEKETTKHILVTGNNGFVGHHLINELTDAGHTVYGASREPEPSPDIAEKLEHYWHVDMMELRDLRRIEWDKIDVVIHLAGLANVGASFDNPQLYHDVNVGIIENLFEAVELAHQKPRIISVSTGAVYGRSDGPVIEETELSPGSPYAESKLESEAVIVKKRIEGYDAINVRPFNHVGPGQGPGFLVPDLGYQIAEGMDPVKAGNLSSSRDYTDVRDVVRAYRLLAEAETLHHAVYNICSGKSVKGEDIFDMLRKAADKPYLEVVVAQDKLRAKDDDIITGSRDRLTEETGWEPQIPIEQTIKDFMEWKLND